MTRAVFGLFLLLMLSCKNESKRTVGVQEIIDRSIEDSGGLLYKTQGTSFTFRNKKYISEVRKGKKLLKRISVLDSVTILDVRSSTGLTRFINDSLIALPDSIANRYANSVNSVHYFARLPYGLNDKAVQKKLLGEETIKGENYFKVKVTFTQAGGGQDFDDTYVYWFNKQTFKIDYLAYDFHVNGGGQRFRVAYNERYIGGIRFVDYYNYKSPDKTSDILGIGKRYEKDELELLSKIELTGVEVTKD